MEINRYGHRFSRSHSDECEDDPNIIPSQFFSAETLGNMPLFAGIKQGKSPYQAEKKVNRPEPPPI